MSQSLSVLDFVRAKRGLRSAWVYGYVSDVGQPIDGVAEWEWIEVQYHNGIKPTTELFAPNQVQAISEEMFDVKTEGQTALHSRYWDDKAKADEKRDAASAHDRHDALKKLLAKWDGYVKRCETMEGYVTMTAEHANQLRAIIAPKDKPRFPTFPDYR